MHLKLSSAIPVYWRQLHLFGTVCQSVWAMPSLSVSTVDWRPRLFLSLTLWLH